MWTFVCFIMLFCSLLFMYGDVFVLGSLPSPPGNSPLSPTRTTSSHSFSQSGLPTSGFHRQDEWPRQCWNPTHTTPKSHFFSPQPPLSSSPSHSTTTQKTPQKPPTENPHHSTMLENTITQKSQSPPTSFDSDHLWVWLICAGSRLQYWYQLCSPPGKVRALWSSGSFLNPCDDR